MIKTREKSFKQYAEDELPKVRPCPFCGGVDLVEVGTKSTTDYFDRNGQSMKGGISIVGYRIQCNTCRVTVSSEKSFCDVRKKWNGQEAQ